MSDMNEFMFNDDDRKYIEMMQANIERMANNSLHCKTWLMGITTSVLLLSKNENIYCTFFILIFFAIVFWFLDVKYLKVERGMRNRQRDFINNKRNNDESKYSSSLYNFTPLDKDEDEKMLGFVSTRRIWKTWSILPFYLCHIVLIIFLILVKLICIDKIIIITKCCCNQ